MGSRASSPGSSERAPETHNLDSIKQKNRAIGLSIETGSVNDPSQKKSSYLPSFLAGGRKHQAGRRYSNALPPPGKVSKAKGSGGKKKKAKGVNYKKVGGLVGGVGEAD